MATTPKKSNIKKAAREGGRRDKNGRPWRPRPQNLPRHTVTPETRAAVQALNALGMTHIQIAEYLTHLLGAPISKTAIQRNYKKELAVGKTHQILVVSQNMYRKAAGSPAQYDQAGNLLRAEVKPDTVAGMFWLKAQANWRDHHNVVKFDPDQPPIPVNVKNLTDAQLEQLLDRLEAKAGQGKKS